MKKIKLMLFIFLIFILPISFAAGPVIESVTIGVTDDKLIGFCNATDADGDYVSYTYRWYNGTDLYEEGTIKGLQYQDTMDTLISATLSNPFAPIVGCEGNITMEYDKPGSGVYDANWVGLFGRPVGWQSNSMVSKGCWNTYPNTFRILIKTGLSVSSPAYVEAYCESPTGWVILSSNNGWPWNPTGGSYTYAYDSNDITGSTCHWQTVSIQIWSGSLSTDYGTSANSIFYEEYVNWVNGSKSFTQGETQNLANLTYLEIDPQVGDTWKFACKANDETTQTLYSEATYTFDEVNVTIIYPVNATNLTKDLITDNFELSISILGDDLDSCWYNHYNSSGFPTSNTLFSFLEGFNIVNVSVDYFGTHTIQVLCNNSAGFEDNDTILFNIQETEETPTGGGGGGGDIEEKETPVPFFVRELTYEHTCGVDADADGILCDPNEDWISCPEDCDFPSLDSLLCYGDECVWREVWFLKLLFAMLLMITIYLVYIDFTAPKRRRKIF